MSVTKRVVDTLNDSSLVRVLKNTRNEIVDRSFRANGRAEADGLIKRLELTKSKNVCFTIAFNVPWVIEALITAWRRFPTNLDLVVANNCSDDGARQAIRALCHLHDVPHVDLPANREWNPNRSHGIAMNWVFYKVVKRLKPEIFGFIDHDCFPIKPHDVTARLKDRDVYGLRYESPKLPGVWNMWAGFCFYRFSSIGHCKLDFKHRVELGLDTGGGNWAAVYRSIEAEKVLPAEYRLLDTTTEAYQDLHSFIDEAFLHVGGASFRRGHQQRTSDTIWNDYLNGAERRTRPAAKLPRRADELVGPDR